MESVGQSASDKYLHEMLTRRTYSRHSDIETTLDVTHLVIPSPRGNLKCQIWRKIGSSRRPNILRRPTSFPNEKKNCRSHYCELALVGPCWIASSPQLTVGRTIDIDILPVSKQPYRQRPAWLWLSQYCHAALYSAATFMHGQSQLTWIHWTSSEHQTRRQQTNTPSSACGLHACNALYQQQQPP